MLREGGLQNLNLSQLKQTKPRNCDARKVKRIRMEKAEEAKLKPKNTPFKSVEGFKTKRPAAKVKKRLVLSSRDEEILQFINDMKFADLECLYLKFFATTQSGEKSKSSWWARDRITQLKTAGLLQEKRYYFENRAFYFLTSLGFNALKHAYPDDELRPKPNFHLDPRIFDHDLKVLKARMHLETTGQASNWKSDKRLAREAAQTYRMKRSVLFPDAIFACPKTKMNFALEIEVAKKNHRRYGEKISAYIYEMRGNYAFRDTRLPAYERVYFFCASQYAANTIASQCRMYSDRFVVRPYDSLFSQPLLTDEDLAGKIQTASPISEIQIECQTEEETNPKPISARNSEQKRE